MNSKVLKKVVLMSLDKQEVEAREDEEQAIKLEEIIDLLVAAGYFRAQIKGLLPFDKVVGGMTWCIEFCNMDVDVDLLFQENSTIGQKIALTEKIVMVLPKMKCPHSIEPYQIQGLDFIHIFPVVQWLVKTSLEFREEMSELVRCYALTQFNKRFSVQNTTKFELDTLRNIYFIEETYGPQRHYKRKNAAPADIQKQVEITLLEYGNVSQDKEIIINETMDCSDVDHDLNTEDLNILAEHYVLLQLEFRNCGTKFLKDKQKLTFDHQIITLDEKCTEMNLRKRSLEELLLNQDTKSKLCNVQMELNILKTTEVDKLGKIEETEKLVFLQENLKLQEQQFKEHCKTERAKLQMLIEQIKSQETFHENSKEVKDLYETLLEEVKALRLQVARRNRIVAALRRQIDDVLNRPELAQYQRRFLELYNQVSAKHKETKQYYTLYNTMEDTKLYMLRELSLLNSLSDNYPQAMLTNSGKEEFLHQFQTIKDGLMQSKDKVEKRLETEKKTRDHLISALHILIEQQRKYVTAIRELSLECKKHEVLSSRKK